MRMAGSGHLKTVERVHSLWYTCNTSKETNMDLKDLVGGKLYG